MFRFLEIRAQRRLEESRHRRLLEIQDRKRARRQELADLEHERKAKFHSVFLVENPNIVDLQGADERIVGSCKPLWALQENGYGDRRFKKEWQGFDPTRNWSTVWEHCTAHTEVLKWVHRDPECTIETKLPPNASSEDRAWDQLGADTQ